MVAFPRCALAGGGRRGTRARASRRAPRVAAIERGASRHSSRAASRPSSAAPLYPLYPLYPLVALFLSTRATCAPACTHRWPSITARAPPAATSQAVVCCLLCLRGAAELCELCTCAAAESETRYGQIRVRVQRVHWATLATLKPRDSARNQSLFTLGRLDVCAPLLPNPSPI